ncbi:DUF4175 family protein [Fibrella sp. ES10-3-2-2]|nr:ATPase [Fibrella sp. ES10-3-2-2]
MVTQSSFSALTQQIDEYKRRYFQNQLIKGSLLFVGILLATYLLLNTVEYYGRFSTPVRAFMLFSFIGLFLAGTYGYIIKPLMGLYGLRKPISDEVAAHQIGQFFPEIGDKLLNTLQLRSLTSSQSDLLKASIEQRSSQLLITRFSSAIQLNKNRKFVKFALIPAAVIGGILLLYPAFFTNSSSRIVQFDKEFVEEAPFRFILDSKRLEAFRNEDFTLKLHLEGDAVPDAVYLVLNDTRFKLENVGKNAYAYTFDNVQRDLDFRVSAAGFNSPTYQLELLDRPSVLSFDVSLTYPAYLGKPSEQLANVGNLLVPEGTSIQWKFLADHADSLAVQFAPGGTVRASQVEDNAFGLTHRATQSGTYSLNLMNRHARNGGDLTYSIQVIPDRFPQINLQKTQDSVTYNYIGLYGLITDDYGFSNLKLVATVSRADGATKQSFTRPIPITASTTSQNYVYNWSLDSLKLQPNDKLDYYVQVADNDGVHGPKTTRSSVMTFAVPSVDQLQQQVEESAEKTEQQMEAAMKTAQAIKKELAQLEERMRTKKSSDFQDKKQLQDILQKRDELMSEIEKLQEQFKKTNDTQQRMNPQQQEAMKQKLEQLQKLFDQMQDPESKKLYDELKQMMEKKQDERSSELMNKLNRKERNLEKELDRALKMFKQMQQDQKAENAIKELEKQAEKQEKLAEKNEKEEAKKDPAALEKQKEEQKKAEEDFKKLQEQLDKLKEDAEKEKLSSPDTQEKEQQDIEKQMDESKKELDKKEQKNAAQSQKKTAKSMRNMAKSMAESMEGMDMKSMSENLDDLRNLLDNLITLSFTQERLMRDFKSMSLQDPRVLKLSQEQIRLQDNAKVLEDSLNSLASREPQIQPFVTRELTNMRYYMDESSRFLKERRLSMASARQQSSMTSINNLSLMLNDAFKQMQDQMNAMAMPGKGKSKGKSKGEQPSPGIGEKQQQLNERIQQLSQGGKQGRALSEELSRLAAEQGVLRDMLKELQDKAKGTEAGKQQAEEVQDLMKKMDETETDLVNKRINPAVNNRQKDILTRLLESEKALRQQEEDPKRQGEAAKQQKISQPTFFIPDSQSRSRQVEALRTVSPAYNLFYKRESNKYLQKLTK